MASFSSWFQLGPIPLDAMKGKYDLVLVGLSYIVAVLASYVALNIVGRLRAEQNAQTKIYWLVGGAFTMGAGIWSMHFIGMLAFVMPMSMEYQWGWTLASLLMAIVASATALFILQKQNYSISQLGLGGFFIGIGISTMHYMGMEGMRFQANIHYLPRLFFLSIAIGIVAAEIALYLALQSNQGSNQKQFILKIISSIIMGFAICGMHYTGMAAAVFTPNFSHVMVSENQVIQSDYLAFFIAGITALIIVLALIVLNSYKKMLLAVANEKDFLNAMLDNLEDGIIACDAKGQITVLNRTLQKNINLIKDNINIDDLMDYILFYTSDNKLLSKEELPLSRALKGERIRCLELIMKFKNNVSHDVVVDGQNIINSEGRNLGAVTIIHDVTELKKTEKLKNEFVSVVSHELRTPLTSIRGSLGLLVSGIMGEFSEKAFKLIEIANNNCDRLLLLINDILDIEKFEAGKMDFQLKINKINDIISESVIANKMYADKYGVSIEFIQPKSSILVNTDSGRLMQVLTNLISNACKFSPKGEKITVKVKQIQSNVRVSVSNNGPGIPKKFQSRIFQKFSQADSSNTRGKEGTGLGLNISKSIIEKLGGALNFVSEPNKSTTFYFDYPIAHEEPAAKSSLSGIHEMNRLLICDDDQDQSDYLKVLLEEAGFTADVANTVAKAKELLSERNYHALLLDLILPDQDGITFIRELRTHDKTKDLNIVVVSVISQTGKRLLNGDAVSVVDWFDKPINFNKLLPAINRIKMKTRSAIPKILHIEDNVDTQHVVCALLEQYASVSTANSLYQAKEMLEKYNYDLIILDLVLPDGNGIEILPLLARYRAPILVFSNMQLNDDYAQYVSQSLIKSNSSNETLLNTIMHLL